MINNIIRKVRNYIFPPEDIVQLGMRCDEILRARNNPTNQPVGPFTGRCSHCHSNDLWDDGNHYGCNCCNHWFSNDPEDY